MTLSGMKPDGTMYKPKDAGAFLELVDLGFNKQWRLPRGFIGSQMAISKIGITCSDLVVPNDWRLKIRVNGKQCASLSMAYLQILWPEPYKLDALIGVNDAYGDAVDFDFSSGESSSTKMLLAGIFQP